MRPVTPCGLYKRRFDVQIELSDVAEIIEIWRT
jgi:hypothetical protein